MADAKNQISAEGRAKAEEELRHLIEVRRPEIVASIKVAREFGDLKENAEYHAAREAQSMNEARIRVLEHHLATAEVTEAAGGERVDAGSRVSFRDKATGKVTEATLVHPLEASVPDGKLSIESPIARALLGSVPGDEVDFETPRGDRKQLEVLGVG
jgi:transcription elongation factor GreA